MHGNGKIKFLREGTIYQSNFKNNNIEELSFGEIRICIKDKFNLGKWMIRGI